MPQRRIQKPKFDGSDSRRSTYDDENSSFFNRADGGSDDGMGTGGQSARKASRRAGQTLGNIDDVLNDTANDAPSGFYNNGQGNGGGSGGSASDDSSFYGGDSGYDDASASDNDSGTETTERSLTPGQINQAENTATTGATKSGSSSEIPFNQEKKQKLTGGQLRKRGIIGGLVSLALGGGIFGLSILSGPAMIVHYGQLLAHITPFQHQETSSDGRMSKMIRWMKESDVGETRLTTWGSIMNKKVQTDFAKQGVSFTRNSVGHINKIVVDTSVDPDYSGLKTEDARAKFLADNPGISADKVRLINGTKNKFAADISSLNQSQKISVLNDYIQEQGLGRVSSWYRLRIAGEYFDLHSWLHPIKRTASNLDEKISRAAEAKLQSDEDSRLKKLIEKSSKIKELNAEIRGKISPGAYKTVGGALIATAGICVAKDVVHAVPELNRLNVVVPAMESAGDAMALSAQIMSGQDIDIGSVSAISKNFTDKDGKTPFQSEAVEKIQGNGLTGASGGMAVNSGVAAAFSPDNSELSIEKFLDGVGADALCSTVGQIAQGVAGLALLVTGTGGLIEKGVQLGTSFAVGVALSTLTQQLSKIIAEDPITGIPHQGANGGNVDGLGAIELSNTVARSEGGVVLSPTQVSELDGQGLNQDFESQSFASRIFNVNDYRSVTGRVIDSQNPQVTQNMANVFGSVLDSFSNVGTVFSGLASALMPRAQAAAEPKTPYGLGNPEYNMSVEDLDNPTTDNGYDNGEWLAKNVFDPNTSDDNITYDGTYADRLHTCFGNTVQKDADGKWIALGAASSDPSDDNVNPNTATYSEANCGDRSDSTWLRLRMFVYDNAQMAGWACQNADGDIASEACKSDGLNSTTSSDDSADTDGASAVISSDDAPSYCTDGSATGNQKIVCSAWQFDDFGYGNGHGDAAFMANMLKNVKTCNSNHFDKGQGCPYSKYQALVDCSGLVDAAVYDATGKALVTGGTSAYPGNSHLKEIDISQAQAGDIAWWSNPDGHTEVVVAYDAASKKLSSFGSHTSSAAGPDQIGADTYPSGSFPLPQKVFRVVP